MSYYSNKGRNQDKDDSSNEEGQIRSSDSQQQVHGQQDQEEGELDEPEENQQGEDQIYDSASSEQDKDRIQEEKKKREDFWKTMNQSKPDVPQSTQNLFQMALQAASKTNKKMLMLRKKNLKKIEELENMRMVQQPYLVSGNTHYRSSINDYPLITIDETGKKYLHPNNSLKVSECRLDQFIQKNISQEGTSNYLNEVVKFQNFAYQHRKKRRQNFQ